MAKKDLVQIIRDNPDCVATIDNDTWILSSKDGKELARDGEVIELGYGYGSGNCYGGDILQALAVIVGITIESV